MTKYGNKERRNSTHTLLQRSKKPSNVFVERDGLRSKCLTSHPKWALIENSFSIEEMTGIAEKGKE